MFIFIFFIGFGFILLKVEGCVLFVGEEDIYIYIWLCNINLRFRKVVFR